MAVRRLLTARYVKRIVLVMAFVVMVRLCWVSMTDAIYSQTDRQTRGSAANLIHGRGDKRDNVNKVNRYIGAQNGDNHFTEAPNGEHIDKNKKLDICHKIVPFRSASPSTISTFDLPGVTNYSLDETRNYRLPQEVFDRAEMPLEEEIQVIVVPFSHADPGYGLTVEDYYRQFTRGVLTLMVEKLTKYPNMTFQWAETVFLERWFKDISDQQKDQVRQLIQSGRLEIVLGGWVMPDEALTRYTSVIDQLIEGHQWLKENLGVVPENAWVNDPFGFSSTMPYLWKSSGMENLVILRIHQAIKATLMKSRSLEFMWRPYWQSDNGNDILTNIMPYTNYWANDVCGPVQKVCKLFNFLHMDDDIGFVWHINDGNIEKVATEMYKAYKLTAGIYEYNNLVIFLGEDNSYSREHSWDNTYTNYMKLMEYVNNKPEWKMKIKFGTIKEYFANVRRQESGKSLTKNGLNSHPKFPVLSGDFFPYSDREDAYWTGYYTTRPWVKKLSRELEPVLTAADVFSVLLYHSCMPQGGCDSMGYEFKQILGNLRSARRELGIYQHHDGITGTSLPYVVLDYETRLMSALEKAQQALKMAVVSLISKGKSGQLMRLENGYTKVDSKAIREDRLYSIRNGGLIVIVANTMEQSRSEIINMVIDTPNVAVYIGNKTIFFQISQLKRLDVAPNRKAFMLSFRVKIGPFEIHKVFIKQTNTKKHIVYKDHLVKGTNTVLLKTKRLRVQFDARTCMLQSITDGRGRVTRIKSEFLKYKSVASGAYLFGPEGPADTIQGLYDRVEIYEINGPLVSEVTCIFSPGFTHRIRLYNTSGAQGQGLHISNTIDLSKTHFRTDDMEVVMRFQTDIQNENIFFTDQNSFQLMGRQTYPDRLIESNYYPISSLAIIEDATKRLALHSAQPNGVASLEDGWLEVMLDRNMGTDDGRGLGSGIFDKINTLSEFILQIEHKSAKSSLEEERYNHLTLNNILLSDLFLSPIQTFAVVTADIGGNSLNHGAVMPSITEYIPGSPQIHLLNFCDTSIVNLRLIVSNDLSIKGTSIVLHRRPVHCSFDHDLKKCNMNSENKVTPSALSTIVGIREQNMDKATLRETSLSHLHTKSQPLHDSDLRPKVNELRTYLIKYNAE